MALPDSFHKNLPLKVPLRWVRSDFPEGFTKYLHPKGEPCPALPSIQMTSMMQHYEKLPQCFTWNLAGEFYSPPQYSKASLGNAEVILLRQGSIWRKILDRLNSHPMSPWAKRRVCRARQTDTSLRSAWQGWIFLVGRNCQIHLNYA